MKGFYMSLLGGVAWMCLTRVGICVDVQSLQRHAHQPRCCDLLRLNIVLRFIKKKVIGIWYPYLGEGELRLSTISDAAFRALVDESAGLALRGYIVLLTREDKTSPAGPDGKCHVLDFGCRRQKRVVRSTGAAENNGGIDSTELIRSSNLHCMRSLFVAVARRSLW